MPIVRLSRDKRGLDTIYLIDTAAEGGRRAGRARVLYFWTAPPGLRVGRNALDETAQRALERAHPDVTFDWPALRKAVDAALAQAAALSTDHMRREAWRGAGKASRGGQRQGSRSDATDPAAPPPASATPSERQAPGAAVAAEAGTEQNGPLESAEGLVATTPEPASDAPAASETADATERRPRRRRRRPRRPSAGASTASPDPIIES